MYTINKKLLKNYCVDLNKSIGDIIENFNRYGKKIVFIKSRDQFVGIIQEGDIRRVLLKKKNILKEKISKIVNKRCIFFYDNEKNLSLKIKNAFLRNNYIEAIPILNKNKKIIRAVFNRRNKITNFENIFLIIAGGKGSRMGKLTKRIPKPLLKYKNKPILDYILKNSIKYNFKKIFISTKYLNSKFDNIIDKYSKKNFYIEKIVEKSFLGTAGSISLIKKENFKNVVVSNADIICDLDYSDLLNHHELENNDLTTCTKETNFQIPFGLINNNYIKNTKIFVDEKPSILIRFNIGIYVFKKAVLKKIKFKEKIDMPSLINKLAKSNFKIGQYHVFENLKHYTSSADFK